jgi:large subunit ribosomal protein L13
LPETPKPTPATLPAKSSASPVVIDATGLVLGRAASLIAKRLLNGESITVIHAEKSVVTGGPTSVLIEYRTRRARGSVRSGPHYPRYPDRIFRRTVRGMLPHLKTRGKQAYHRLEVFLGCPPELSGAHAETLDQAKPRPSLVPPISLGEISHDLGARL